MKSTGKYTNLIHDLLEYPNEQEWFEFKASWNDPHDIGEYISALANTAAFHGRDFGYMIWGIDDESRQVVGTLFDPEKDVKHEPLKHYLARQLTPDTAFGFYELKLEGKRCVLLEIAAAKNVPVSFANVR